jgi:hypothetical protein
MWIDIVFGFATALYMLSRKYWSGGIVFLLFSVFYVICFISWIPRIPFSVLMLQTAIDVSKKYGHTYMVSLIGGLLAAALGAWYSVTLVAIYVQYTPNQNNGQCRNGNGVGGCSSGKVIGLLVFVTFAMYWISEWLKNTIHTTISGCVRLLVLQPELDAQRSHTWRIQAFRYLQFWQHQSGQPARCDYPVHATNLLGRTAQRGR